MPGKIAFRPPLEQDTNFILSSWAESFRRSPWSGVLPDKAFYDAHRAHLRSILSRPSTSILCCVAEGEEPPNDMFGWGCWEGKTLHYIYVKHLYRKMGVGRAILSRTGLDPKSEVVTYTFKTRAAVDYTRSHNAERWRFDPRDARYGTR